MKGVWVSVGVALVLGVSACGGASGITSTSTDGNTRSSGAALAAPSCAEPADVAECAKACGVDPDDVAERAGECVACVPPTSEASACLSSCFGVSVRATCAP